MRSCPGCLVRTSFRGARLRRVPEYAADLGQRQQAGRQVRLADDDYISHVYILPRFQLLFVYLRHLLLKQIGCVRVCFAVYIESTPVWSASRARAEEDLPAHKASSVEAYTPAIYF